MSEGDIPLEEAMRRSGFNAPNVVQPSKFIPSPLFDPWEAYAVPDFPLDALPSTIREFIGTQADLIGGDANALAMACLATIGSALDHRFAVKVMRHGDWWASPRLWLLLCGDPSRKKTPIINAATRPLEEVQSEAWQAWEQARDEHEKAELPEEDTPPRPPRYVATDTTVEKLAEIMTRYARGLLIKRDELSGWIGSMERYSGSRGGAADRAFWLQAYDGGKYTIDRVNRGERTIQNLSVAIMGGIQPERLAEMRGLTTDGLLQRFIPVMLKASRSMLHPAPQRTPIPG